MLDIEDKKYSARKEYEYDDDTAVLFYRGTKIARALTENFRNLESKNLGTVMTNQ